MTETMNNRVYSSNLGETASSAITKGYVVTLNSFPIGVAAKDIAAGEILEIHPYGERRSGIAGAAITAGAQLKADGSNKLIPVAAAGDIAVAIAIGSASADGDEVEIWTISPETYYTV